MKKRLAIKRILSLLALVLLFTGIQKIDWFPARSLNCPFCNPATVKKHLVIQGAHASVIATYKPAVPGHLLVIPNRHVQTFELLEGEEVTEIAALTKQVHQLYVNRFQATDYVLIQKNGRLAGQSVPHVHFHILPRTKDRSLVNFILHYLCRPFFKPMDEEETRDYIELF